MQAGYQPPSAPPPPERPPPPPNPPPLPPKRPPEKIDHRNHSARRGLIANRISARIPSAPPITIFSVDARGGGCAVGIGAPPWIAESSASTPAVTAPSGSPR